MRHVDRVEVDLALSILRNARCPESPRFLIHLFIPLMDECADYVILSEEAAQLGEAHQLTLLGHAVVVLVGVVVEWCGELNE